MKLSLVFHEYVIVIEGNEDMQLSQFIFTRKFWLDSITHSDFLQFSVIVFIFEYTQHTIFTI